MCESMCVSLPEDVSSQIPVRELPGARWEHKRHDMKGSAKSRQCDIVRLPLQIALQNSL